LLGFLILGFEEFGMGTFTLCAPKKSLENTGAQNLWEKP